MGTEQPSAADASSNADVWTVQRILEWTTGFLKQKGIESARLEAELLLAHARQCQRIRLYTDFDAIVTDDQRGRMREMVQRRAKREPLAYLIGSREFYGRSFEVGHGVLIPRPETETLIDVCLEYLPRDAPQLMAEVGFGSGCISITLARQCPQLEILATDISEAALKFASSNVRRHDVGDRVQLMTGDCLQPVAEGLRQQQELRKLDGLVSNPPYIREDEMAGLQPEVGQHEPHSALVAGKDGLDVVRRIISESPALLRAGGFVALELDPAQCDVVVSLMETAGFTQVGIRRDLSGNDRVVYGRMPHPSK